MKRKVKMELVLALVLAMAFSFFTVYTNLPRRGNLLGFGPSQHEMMLEESKESMSQSTVQQFVKENIQGELTKGSFEVVVEGLRNLTFHYSGTVPLSNMLYENDLWGGTMNCNVPTENVTSFAFDVRRLIGEYGKVTYITISITEVRVNQTGQTEEPLSEITIALKEFVDSAQLPIINQIGTVVPWLVTSLVWIAQGLIVAVPLCFVSLGIVLLVDKGILPMWRKQFKPKNLVKPQPST